MKEDQKKELAVYQERPSQKPIGIFTSPAGFDEWQRMALALCTSSLVPLQYQGKGNLGNCLIALNMAARMSVDPLMLMQNMDPIHGKPALSSKFLIALTNDSGKFSPLRFEFEDRGRKAVKYRWRNDKNDTWKEGTENIEDQACRAIAKDLKSGETLVGEWVSIELAVKEGWYTKAGSKWPNMPGQMLRYRAASFWSNIYFPEGKLGMPTREEVIDIGYEYEEIKDNENISQLNKSSKNANTPTSEKDDRVLVVAENLQKEGDAIESEQNHEPESENYQGNSSKELI